jgi:hypothetical protein
MMNDIRRIRHSELFIQSRKCRNGLSGYLAWSSSQPSEDVLNATGVVHFMFDPTEDGAIAKLKLELDSLEKNAL